MPILSRLGALFVLGAVLTACANLSPSQPSVSTTPARQTTLPISTATRVPTTTPLPTWTPSATPSATPLPERIRDAHSILMLLVPAGEFIMGSEQGFPDEVPVHNVYVDAFYIDINEVTNKQYQECVEAGVCQPPRRVDCCSEKGIGVWPSYYGNRKFDDYPVIFINWHDALDYCDWRGSRLLTEAEWEKASRGPDGRTYPWGNEEPTPQHLNFTWLAEEFDKFGGRPLYTTSPVGSYPMGASPYGVLDLAGNVYEWVYDVYAPDYYENSPYRNPTGPEGGSFRVTRGGSFFNQAYRNRSSNRNNAYIPANSVHFDGGARCGKDTP
ncbi:MAG: SUMF1/EgtB/PvdO family nonheme iron enzyme [Anaerolineae bacterium]|nr:SUMF1/EgtB/PvdO family nonheme iron enzyme [Anaerolineae bacterium]